MKVRNKCLACALALAVLMNISACGIYGGMQGKASASGVTAGTTEETFPAVETTAHDFEDDSVWPYAYETLSETERLWYRDINETLAAMESEIPLSDEGLEAGLDETDVERIFQCVLLDHPEYFFVEGYYYTKYTRLDKPVKIEFSGNYSVGPEEAEARREQIETAVSELLAGIDESADDYEKLVYVYETLIRETDYDLEAPDNQNIYSVFVGNASVCQGYAKATQYLLNHLGVGATLVMGTVEGGEGHAWNLVQADGAYYYVDTTWGDASYKSSGELGETGFPEINYDYLCVTTEQLLRTHVIEHVVPLPECAATEDNYYIRNGYFFEVYDEEHLSRIFAAAAEQGLADVTLKCADESCYAEMRDRLIGEQEIFRYMSIDYGTIAYAQNQKQLSLTFWVTNQEQM